jgi:hypothetical protein
VRRLFFMLYLLFCLFITTLANVLNSSLFHALLGHN